MAETKGIKEAFAKFFEDPDRVKFKELVQNNTGEYNHIDFKESWIKDEKLAKNILVFANNRGGIIVFGIKENSDRTLTSTGLDSMEDKAQIIKRARSYIPESLIFDIDNFSFTESEYAEIKGKNFQVLRVEDSPEYIPFLSLKGGNGIKKNVIYYRGSVNTEEATHEQVQEIISRRIDTGYSTTREITLREHLIELRNLYNMISKYDDSGLKYNMTVFMASLGGGPNRHYPKEGFDEFINRMITIKKQIIESMINDRW
jgi:predicted HTH transcriptional regulator